jgi:hypothetical protein
VRALDALHMAEVAGVKMMADGDRLRLRADRRPPTEIVEALRQHKADILALLISRNGKFAPASSAFLRPHDNQQAFEQPRTEWLNSHPEPTEPGRCAWCGRSGAASSVVVPFGTRAHTWLHPECWVPWRARRLERAGKAVRKAGEAFNSQTESTH